jgi:dihydrofolate reductase
MPKLVVMTGVSLDLFVAAPDGSHPFAEDEVEATKRWKLDVLERAGAHLMGRVTYEEMARAWPGDSGEYADIMNSLPKVVFSRTLQEAGWEETRIASGDLAAEVERAKADHEGDLVAYGGARFLQALSREGLVDEYRLTIHPTAIGEGMPLFAGLDAPLRLELVEANAYDNGAVGHVYRPR